MESLRSLTIRRHRRRVLLVTDRARDDDADHGHGEKCGLEIRMFGLSLMKLLFTAAVVVLVWQGYRWWQRNGRRSVGARRGGELRGRRRNRESAPVEDMTRCTVCGDYVPASAARACGRADCPYPD